MASFIRLLALAALALVPASAHAEWKEATSANFIVYSEGSDQQLKDFSAKLEKFNFILRTFHKVTAPPSANKLKVYLFPDIKAVGRMAGRDRVAGYYVTEARGPMMVGTRSSTSTASIDSESILLHEYTHHFMYQYFPATYPTWYSEGFAEFWGATKILPGDIVEVGAPAEYRFGSFFENRWLPIRQLLTAQSYADVPDLDLLYAEGWLLVRYVFDNDKRRQQLQAYLKAINGGASYADAMTKSFPDVGALNSEIFNFARRTRFSIVRLPFRPINPGAIDLRTLRPAEQALLEYEIRINQGFLQSEAKEFANKVRSVAGRHSTDPFALATLAEAEGLAGNKAEALAVIEKLLAIQPDHARALTQKALLQIDALRAAGSKDKAAWQAARQHIVRASKAAPNDPIVLEAFHRSFLEQGLLPPDAAQNALYKAMELAPSDSDLRYRVARDFEQRDLIREAIAIIRPSAFVLPHRKNESERDKKKREEREEKYREAGEQRRETAREMFDRLQTKLGEKSARSAPKKQWQADGKRNRCRGWVHDAVASLGPDTNPVRARLRRRETMADSVSSSRPGRVRSAAAYSFDAALADAGRAQCAGHSLGASLTEIVAGVAAV